MDIAAKIADRLVGQQLLDITHRESDAWLFNFSSGAHLEVDWPWRVVVGGKVAFGEQNCREQLLDKSVETVTIREGAADIIITFNSETSLEVLNMASGFEGWQFGSGGGLLVVVTGSGGLSLWGD